MTGNKSNKMLVSGKTRLTIGLVIQGEQQNGVQWWRLEAGSAPKGTNKTQNNQYQLQSAKTAAWLLAAMCVVFLSSRGVSSRGWVIGDGSGGGIDGKRMVEIGNQRCSSRP